uniref:Uncharacterized protein n=1 Tax=Globodera rostochiensis TaxID=31243 RepID=A0A914I6U9_GLORO
MMFTYWPGGRLSLPDGLHNNNNNNWHCFGVEQYQHNNHLPSCSLPQGINAEQQNHHYYYCRLGGSTFAPSAMSSVGRKRRGAAKHYIGQTPIIQRVPLKCSIGTQTDNADENFFLAEDEAELVELCAELANRLLTIADEWAAAKLETDQQQQQQPQKSKWASFLNWICPPQ